MRKTMVLILSLIMICTASVFIAFNTPAYTASAHSTDQENDCLSDCPFDIDGAGYFFSSYVVVLITCLFCFPCFFHCSLNKFSDLF